MNAIRSVRVQPPAIFSTSQSFLSNKSPVISFRPVVTSVSRQQDQNPESMDKQAEKNPNEESGDVMSHSFGEGYATRADEEGFGGIYGGNQSLTDKKSENEIDGNHPAYDKTQGSEVKEKEKARHQKQASC